MAHHFTSERFVNFICFTALTLAVLIFSDVVPAQTFTEVTDSGNALATANGPTGYTGASWIDFDNDGDLDLFLNNTRLFRNTGDGSFESVITTLGASQALQTGNGNSWADYDNDGDLDVFISSGISALYRNDGNAVFTRITTGAIGDGSATRGWSCAWADFDNDGNVDLAITHPAGFVPPGNNPTTNHLFRNDGPPNYTFTRITTGPIVTGLAAYTVGTWSDFDQDGDMDYFVGAGPANGTTARDFLYRNLLAENGSANFERINSGVIATDLQDGQVWNWIDYDNDGDLDAYLTNWGGPQGGIANRLYRNNDGTFEKISTGSIVSDRQISLSSVWGDFDNDGDLDCYVANDSGQPDRYYRNNGDGTFTQDTAIGIAEAQTRRGATAGDYDNDGDLDLLAVGPNTGTDLYRNDTDNGNNWLSINCVGTRSNRAGIGTKVSVRATIGGQSVWQLREVSAQNTFNGHNSLRAHFGLGDATAVDSLVLRWSSGFVDRFGNLDVNQILTIAEESSVTSVREAPGGPATFELGQNYPNPFNPVTTIEYDLSTVTQVHLQIYNTLGQEIRTLVNATQSAGLQRVNWDGKDNSGTQMPSGVYVYKLRAGGLVKTQKMLLLR